MKKHTLQTCRDCERSQAKLKRPVRHCQFMSGQEKRAEQSGRSALRRAGGVYAGDLVGTEGAHLSGDQKGLDCSSQPKFEPLSWRRMVNHGDVFIQKLLQSAAYRRFAGARQRAGRARAQRRPPQYPIGDLTCGRVWTFFLEFGLHGDAGHVTHTSSPPYIYI